MSYITCDENFSKYRNLRKKTLKLENNFILTRESTIYVQIEYYILANYLLFVLHSLTTESFIDIPLSNVISWCSHADFNVERKTKILCILVPYFEKCNNIQSFSYDYRYFSQMNYLYWAQYKNSQYDQWQWKTFGNCFIFRI